MLYGYGGEHEPWGPEAHMPKVGLEQGAVYRAGVSVEKTYPVAKLTETHTTGKKVVPKVFKDVESIELVGRKIHVDTVEAVGGKCALFQGFNGDFL
jgi:hypothetical protein